jgi:hypothetical protein
MLEQLLETPLRVGKGLRYLLAQSLQATRRDRHKQRENGDLAGGKRREAFRDEGVAWEAAS